MHGAVSPVEAVRDAARDHRVLMVLDELRAYLPSMIVAPDAAEKGRVRGAVELAAMVIHAVGFARDIETLSLACGVLVYLKRAANIEEARRLMV